MASLKQTPLTCSGHTRPVVHLAFSDVTDCGYFLISACKDGQPMLRQGDTGDWIGTFMGHKGAVWGVALNPDATKAATGSADSNAKLWDAITGEEIHSFQHNRIVKAVAFSKDSGSLVTGSTEKLIRVFDINKPEASPAVISGHTGALKDVAFLGEDKIASIAQDKTLRLWDRRAGTQCQSVTLRADPNSMEISKDESIITISHGCSVSFWNINNGLELFREVTIPTQVNSASLHPDKTIFVCGGEDLKMYKFDYTTGCEIASGRPASVSVQGMDEDHPNILHAPAMPMEIPSISLGQFIFSMLKSHNPYDVLMVEADTGRLITPVEFLSLSIRVAEALKDSGLQPGDIVSIMGKAKIDVYATATGILFQGATVSPVDHKLPPDVFRLILKATSPKFVFCDAEVADAVAEVLSQLDIQSPIILYNEDPESETPHQTFERFVKTNVDFQNFRPVPTENPDESLAFLVCSSGTMGVPKPVMISDRNLMFQVTVWRITLSFNKFMSCPMITFSYFFWISGILLYMMSVCLNVEMTIVQKLEPKHVLRVIDRQKPVWGMFSPALLKNLTWYPDFKKHNVSSLMMMITGGTSLQKVVVDRVRELWGSHLSCRQSYGVTEISGVATVSRMEDDVLSVGHLVPGFHMKIVNAVDGSILGPRQEGEIYLKSPSVMKGYLGNEEATSLVLKDGWYKTGDLGWYTESGVIYITGRVKDFIRFNGVLISPLEIEEVILGIPGVADAGVVGILADEENQLPVALVVRMRDSEVTQEDILKVVHESLPEEKQIRGGVFFVDSIPRTPSGKMKRVELMDKAKALYAEE